MGGQTDKCLYNTRCLTALSDNFKWCKYAHYRTYIIYAFDKHSQLKSDDMEKSPQ